MRDEKAIALLDWMLIWIAQRSSQPKETLSADTVFIAYGFDSIIIAEFIFDINQYASLCISPYLVWDYPSPQKLCNYILDNHLLQAAATIPLLNGKAPKLSPGQFRLWYMQWLYPEATLFNIGATYECTGTLDTDKFAQACSAILQRHEVLRTIIRMKDNTPYPFILPMPTEIYQTISLHPGTNMQEIIRQEIRKPYDLTQGPLIRIRLLFTNSEKFYVLVAAHHLIIDGGSIPIFMQELLQHYENNTSLSPLAIGYYDIATWQQEQLETNALRPLIDYWVHYLKGASTYLSLPFDKPASAFHSNHIETFSFTLPHTLGRDVQLFCQQYTITPTIVFLTAYQLLLTHYSQQQELVIGFPVNGRELTESKDLIGFFVNTLAIRLNITTDITLMHLLKINQNQIADLLLHQSVPLIALLNQLDIERNALHESLFQVMFAMQNQYREDILASKFQGSLYHVESGQLPYEITLEIFLNKELYHVTIHYNRSRFATETIVQMSQHYQEITLAMMLSSQKPALSLSFMKQEEIERFKAWNETFVPYPKHLTLVDLFEQQANLSPDTIALKTPYESITYQSLNQRANQVARYLQSLAVGSESVIAVSFKNPIEVIIGLLAVLKAGAAHLYLDPTFPDSLQEAIRNDAKPTLILTEMDGKKWSSYSSENLDVRISPESLAYVIFTSGTTGKPKGIMIEHQSISNRLHWYIDTPIEVSSFLHLFSFNFDGALAALWWPLLKGGTVVLLEPLTHLQRPIGKYIAEEKITTLHATPSLLEGILAAATREELQSITEIIIAGEAFSISLKNKINQMTKARIWNFYGPTECSIISTCYLLHQQETETIPIGKPIANTECYILDAQQNRLPRGIIGELYIAGVGLARGYINNPTLTAQRFLSPSSTLPRLYRTGDLVRYDSDGNLEFLARKDRQIKLRGYRIELDAIESILQTYTEIERAYVIVRVDNAGQKKLYAYLVLRHHQLNLIQQYAQKALPSYMIPDYWIIVPKLPLTTQGKIDFRKLPIEKNTLHSAFIAPSTAVEKQLAEIWGQLLKINYATISIHDDFFALGGDSILLLQCIFVCEQKELPITARDLFRYKTIEKLSQHIEKKDKSKFQRYGRKPLKTWFSTIKSRLLSLCKKDSIEIQGTAHILANSSLIITTNHLLWLHLIRIAPLLKKKLGLQQKPYTLSARGLLFLHPITALFSHPLYLHRKANLHDQKILESSVRYLQNGAIFLVSPEGKKNKNRLISAKNGISYLAARAKAPILPIAIYKKNATWAINIGEIIPTSTWQSDSASLEKQTNQIMYSIAALLPEAMRGVYR